VVVAGAPGVGKSRLAHELLGQGRQRGFRGIVGRCFEQYSTVPFFAWIDALADGLGAASPVLRREAPDRWPELQQLLAEFAGRQENLAARAPRRARRPAGPIAGKCRARRWTQSRYIRRGERAAAAARGRNA
jgi:predicted ATPase